MTKCICGGDYSIGFPKSQCSNNCKNPQAAPNNMKLNKFVDQLIEAHGSKGLSTKRAIRLAFTEYERVFGKLSFKK